MVDDVLEPSFARALRDEILGLAQRQQVCDGYSWPWRARATGEAWQTSSCARALSACAARQMYANCTHFVQPGGKTELMEKHMIYETELALHGQGALCAAISSTFIPLDE